MALNEKKQMRLFVFYEGEVSRKKRLSGFKYFSFVDTLKFK